MSYVTPFDPATPVGATTPANQIDEEIRKVKAAVRERLEDVFGADWKDDDPIEPTKLGPGIEISGRQAFTPIYNAGNSGTALTLDFDNGDQQRFTLTGNCTLTLTNVKAGASYLIYIIQDGAGNRVVTFPASVRGSNGVNLGNAGLTTSATRMSIVSLTAYTTGVLFGTVVGTGINVS